MCIYAFLMITIIKYIYIIQYNIIIYIIHNKKDQFTDQAVE